VAGAKESFLDGADWADTAGVVAVLLGATLVYFLFPKADQEKELLASYHAQDTERSPASTATAEAPALPPQP
jgi:DHA2 family multidrug resistance protein-like MFS transporter